MLWFDSTVNVDAPILYSDGGTADDRAWLALRTYLEAYGLWAEERA